MISFDSEQWKVIDEFPQYRISDHGRIFSEHKGRLLVGSYDTDGYRRVILYPGKCGRMIHTLVAAAFIGPRPEGLQINHIDGVKTNNHVSNLEYVTPGENTRHAIRTGIYNHKGEGHHAARLSEIQVKGICRLLSEGIKGRYIAGLFGITEFTVCDIKRGKTWGHLPEVQAAATLPSGLKANRPSLEVCSQGGKAACLKRWGTGNRAA